MTEPVPDAVPAADGAWPAWAQAARRKGGEAGGRGRAQPEGDDGDIEGGQSVDGNHVTLKLVAISVAVAIAAFTVGNWVGNLNARMDKTDAALASLVNTVNGHESRVRALEGK